MQEAINNFCSIVDRTVDLLKSSCPKQGSERCNSADFAYWQWSNSYFTRLPALGLNKDSVSQIDDTIMGFPEISYFKQNLEKKLKGSINEKQFDGVDFGSPKGKEEFSYLFYIPPTDFRGELPETSLFNIETLIQLFDMTERMEDVWEHPDHQIDFSEYAYLTEKLKLKDLKRTYLLTLWLKKMLTITAMRESDGGDYLTTNLIGVATGGIQGAHQWLSREFPSYLYGSIMANSNSKDCETNLKNYIREIEDKQIPLFCNNTRLDLVSAESYSFYSLLYFTRDYDMMQYIYDHTGLSEQNMQSLLNPGYYLERSVMTAMKKVKKIYGDTYCTRSVGNYCSNRELAIAQWFNNSISDNPPRPLNASANLVDLLGVKHYKPELRTYYERIGAEMPDMDFNSTWELVSSGQMYNGKFIGDTLLKQNSTGQLAKYNTPAFLKYTKMLMLEEAMGGLFIQKTVKEYLEGYEDKILKLTKLSQIEEGGDPTINPKISITNQDSGSYNSTGCFFVGDDVHELTRTQCLYLNSKYIQTMGTNVTGIRSWEEKVLFHPWKEPVPLIGTDAGQFHPLQKKPGDLMLFSSDVMMPVRFEFDKHVRKGGLGAWKYKPGSELLSNSTEDPGNEKFYIGFHGALNLTSIFGAPAYASKGHYLDIAYNEKHTSLLKDKEGKEIKAERGKDDLYMIVEPWTGVTMEAALRLQLNFMIEPNDFIFENFKQSYLVPYTYIRKEYGMTKSQIDEGLGPVRSALNASLGIQITGYLLGSILVLVGVFLFYWAWRTKNNEGIKGYTKVEDTQPMEVMEKKQPLLNQTMQLSKEETKDDADD